MNRKYSWERLCRLQHESQILAIRWKLGANRWMSFQDEAFFTCLYSQTITNLDEFDGVHDALSKAIPACLVI